MQLTDYLLSLTSEWALVTGRTPGALSTQVVNDGKLFTRMARGGKITTATFERFLAFFRDGENWPDNRIPFAAAELLDGLECIAVADLPSTGKTDAVSRGVAA